MANALDFLYENPEMGMNILMAACESKTSKVIDLGRSCIYPRENSGFLTENLILTGELEHSNEGWALEKLAVFKLWDIFKSKVISKHGENCNSMQPLWRIC